MTVRTLRFLVASLCCLLGCLISSVSAQELSDPFFEDTYQSWSPFDEITEVRYDQLSPTGLVNPEAAGLQPIADVAVEPVQMLAPQSRQSPRTAQRPSRTSSSRRNQNLASVPFMIGDTGSGTCLTIGGANTFAIEHPTLTCSRLNVSENNTPLPIDRTFVSYRHFKNVTGVRLLTGFTRDYNVDRLTLGQERTFCDGMCSLELRLPLERRLSSNFASEVSLLSAPPIIDPFIGGRQNELANVSAMFKALLLERQNWHLSAGLGVTIPTARDFTYGYYFDRRADLDLFPGAPNPDTFRFDTEEFGIEIQNETVYLSPFLAWQWQPQRKFFHQGFLQVEVAANESTATAFGGGISEFTQTDFTPVLDITFTAPNEGRSTEYLAQTLMRLNLGCGYVFTENQNASIIKRLTGLFEMHITTTLQEPKRSRIPLDVETFPAVPIPPELQNFFSGAFTLGNERRSTTIVNAVAGLSANIGRDGRTVVTNGLILPVSQGDQRAFDLEYNLQVQRLY